MHTGLLVPLGGGVTMAEAMLRASLLRNELSSFLDFRWAARSHEGNPAIEFWSDSMAVFDLKVLVHRKVLPIPEFVEAPLTIQNWEEKYHGWKEYSRRIYDLA